MSEQTKTDKKRYKKTLNLPKTRFSMRANLVQNEPAMQKRWDEMELYRRVREARAGHESFVFHDGPPYPNGPIHLGHLFNKVLKDLVVRSKTMAGYDTPYVPGWDCHGLPIEHKVMQESFSGGPEGRASGDQDPQDRVAIRRACRKYADKFVKLQSKQMQRLLTLGDYEDPYLTMAPRYEADELEVFARMVEAGLVYRGLKPVHWSIENRTALAEAELEYRERKDTSIYAMFEVANPQDLPGSLMARPGGGMPSLMIWTTTPWTLPANLAIAAAPDAEYVLCRWENAEGGGMTIVAADLAQQVFERTGAHYEQLGLCTGAELEAAGVRYRHPFIDRTSPVVTADYVTLEHGTGLVHTAPGHGAEDYQTGSREGLDIYCPVQGDGTFDDTVPDWLRGTIVWDANDRIVEQLRESGHLLHTERFTHSYPHDWRGKTPTIFRATEQWFVDVDKPFEMENAAGDAQHPTSLRHRALDAAADVAFHPDWGRNRMRGMLESRPDWCISRQRSWGLPIPAFHGSEPGQVLLTPASVRAVARLLREKGSDVWFAADPDDLLQHYDARRDPDAPDWARRAELSPRLRKGTDTFDVWFDSGTSWNNVIGRRFGEPALPTNLYVEGSDQHRGWFQVSLLTALGATGRPPFHAILTHGFMVDAQGGKMSKSLGNVIEVEDLLKSFGADVCRWWVSGLNYSNDVKVDWTFFEEAGDAYRKLRNTIRFLLSNLYDFDLATDHAELSEEDATSVDAWALSELDKLIHEVRGAYESYDFRKAHETIFNFCNHTMSAVFLAAVKDRLYCDKPDSPRRRRTQTTMRMLADALIRLLAPILAHTSDEAWLALHDKAMDDPDCVHLHPLPDAVEVVADPDWAKVMADRDVGLKAIETARVERDVDNPLDLGLVFEAGEDHAHLRKFAHVDLADLCGVSRARVAPREKQGLKVVVEDLTDEPRCERSWKRDGTVKERVDGGWLSDRDAEAVGIGVEYKQ